MVLFLFMSALEILSSKLRSDIESAADEAYRSLYDESELLRDQTSLDVVHRLSICGSTTRKLVNNLRERNHPAYIFDATFERSGDYFEHYYAVLRLGGRAIIADPTWTQFIENDIEALRQPKVLIGTRGQVAEYAKNNGVDDELLMLWDRKAGLSDQSVHYPNPRIVTDPALIDLL
ncbi:MAG TPA: hypothetical protein VIM31_01135 [Candidatus Microsaccharimonas sp.]|jgi:hypothetical protein